MKNNVEKFVKIDFMYYDLRYENTGIGDEKTVVRTFHPLNYS
jgi:hypothetical protein